MMERWQNQQEAYDFAMEHPACMLDMEMGTGKTRVALDVAFDRDLVDRILVVCPKAVLGVWEENIRKFHDGENWACITLTGNKAIKAKTETLRKDLEKCENYDKVFVVVNYDAVWRKELGDFIYQQAGFDMVILDESHRAKSPGSKVSKYLAMLGKRVHYKMCLSGTPMANSPLDVYGQYRFLDTDIFGSNYGRFQQQYAILGGPNMNWVIGYKNQQDLNRRFSYIAYTCKMSDIADRIKLPAALPPTNIMVDLPAKDKKVIKELSKEFVAECEGGHIIANNVLVKMLRIQQICSGFCFAKESVFDNGEIQELNTAKEDTLADMLLDIGPKENVVVFCTFRHDLEAIHRAANKAGRDCFELSGSQNSLDQWKVQDGAVIAVQIQAGSEGVDMTKANHAIYFSVPHSLAMYNQSKARLYRPGQTRPVSFCHLIVEGTVDEAMYRALIKKEDIMDSIKAGTFDFGYIKY
jgi:SNF2 family DNA or RNA helicase